MSARRKVLTTMTSSIFVLAVAAACPAAEPLDAEQQPSVESRITWMTPLQPEVHLLLINPQEGAQTFSVFFGADGGIVCEDKLETGDIEVDLRLHRFDTLFAARSSGLIPPEGWAHREIILGSDGSVGPCSVPYVVEFGDDQQDRVRGVIHVPRSPKVEVSGFLVPVEWGEAEAMIESTGLPDRYMLRILVRNLSEKILSIAVTNRRLQCESSGRAKWDLQGGAPTESGVGPVWLSVDGWAVFVAPIRVQGVSCRGSVEISAAGGHGASYSEPLTIRFSLEAVGRISVF